MIMEAENRTFKNDISLENDHFPLSWLLEYLEDHPI